MPNTEVKLFSAEDTCGLPYWENRKSPVFYFIYSSLAQLVEHAAVNRRVVSSSLTRGAKKKRYIVFKTLYTFSFWPIMYCPFAFTPAGSKRCECEARGSNLVVFEPLLQSRTNISIIFTNLFSEGVPKNITLTNLFSEGVPKNIL